MYKLTRGGQSFVFGERIGMVSTYHVTMLLFSDAIKSNPLHKDVM